MLFSWWGVQSELLQRQHITTTTQGTFIPPLHHRFTSWGQNCDSKIISTGKTWKNTGPKQVIDLTSFVQGFPLFGKKERNKETIASSVPHYPLNHIIIRTKIPSNLLFVPINGKSWAKRTKTKWTGMVISTKDHILKLTAKLRDRVINKEFDIKDKEQNTSEHINTSSETNDKNPLFIGHFS